MSILNFIAHPIFLQLTRTFSSSLSGLGTGVFQKCHVEDVWVYMWVRIHLYLAVHVYIVWHTYMSCPCRWHSPYLSGSFPLLHNQNHNIFLRQGCQIHSEVCSVSPVLPNILCAVQEDMYSLLECTCQCDVGVQMGYCIFCMCIVRNLMCALKNELHI